MLELKITSPVSRIIDSKYIRSFSFFDETGLKNDRIEFVLPLDRSVPKKSVIKPIIAGKMDCGLFTVTKTQKIKKQDAGEIEHQKIIATSTPLTGNFYRQKNRAFEKRTLAQIATQIANESEFKIYTDAKDIYREYIAQKMESDAAFLARLAIKYNLIYNVKNGFVVLAKKPPGNRITTIEKSQTRVFSLEENEKTRFSSITAFYRSTKENEVKEITLGSGEPNLFIKEFFESESDALKKAEEKQRENQENTDRGEALIKGQALFAGQAISFEGEEGIFILKRSKSQVTSKGWDMKLEFVKRA